MEERVNLKYVKKRMNAADLWIAVFASHLPSMSLEKAETAADEAVEWLAGRAQG